jgi:hypothetical protein
MHPKALTGMMTGSSIMFVFAILWFLLGLSGGRFFPLGMKVAVVVVGLALGAAIITLAVQAHRISRTAPAPTAEQLDAGRKVGRRFGVINGIQWSAVVAVIILLNVVRRPDFIAPAIAVIVGLHFLPLAGLFQQPQYYISGIVGCAIGVAGFLIPDQPARLSAVGLSFGVLLWFTVMTVLWRVYGFIRGQYAAAR